MMKQARVEEHRADGGRINRGSLSMEMPSAFSRSQSASRSTWGCRRKPEIRQHCSNRGQVGPAATFQAMARAQVNIRRTVRMSIRSKRSGGINSFHHYLHHQLIRLPLCRLPTLQIQGNLTSHASSRFLLHILDIIRLSTTAIPI